MGSKITVCFKNKTPLQKPHSIYSRMAIYIYIYMCVFLCLLSQGGRVVSNTTSRLKTWGVNPTFASDANFTIESFGSDWQAARATILFARNLNDCAFAKKSTFRSGQWTRTVVPCDAFCELRASGMLVEMVPLSKPEDD